VGVVAAVDTTSCSINPGLAVATYSTNPQNTKSPFTWLPAIANQYERYRIRRLRFVYEANAASTATGKIAMYIDYDPSDDAKTAKADVLNEAGCVHGSVWTNHTLTYSHPQATKWLLTRAGALNTNQNQIDTDAGTFVFNTFDLVVAGNIGSIFVEYEIEFDIPQMP
jgi:hypothetical protein